jgi:hypothetical protein
MSEGKQIAICPMCDSAIVCRCKVRIFNRLNPSRGIWWYTEANQNATRHRGKCDIESKASKYKNEKLTSR